MSLDMYVNMLLANAITLMEIHSSLYTYLFTKLMICLTLEYAACSKYVEVM